MNKKIEGIIPPFNKLEEKCVYCPSQLNFPAADIIYKEGKELYLIQITIQVKLKKDIKRGALNDLFKILEITSKNKPDIIHFILCPLPSLKKNYRINFVEDEISVIDYDWDETILIIPKDYKNEP